MIHTFQNFLAQDSCFAFGLSSSICFSKSSFLSLKFLESYASAIAGTKSGLIAFIIALLAYLDLKAAPFFIVWLTSYYLQVA